MKKHQIFCFVLIIITSFIFCWVAKTILGETLGYIAIIISLVIFSTKMIRKIDA